MHTPTALVCAPWHVDRRHVCVVASTRSVSNYCARDRFDTGWVEGYGQPPLMPITVARNIKELACEVRAAILPRRASVLIVLFVLYACMTRTYFAVGLPHHAERSPRPLPLHDWRGARAVRRADERVSPGHGAAHCRLGAIRRTGGTRRIAVITAIIDDVPVWSL